MIKLLKNTTVSSIAISDTGITISASPGTYTIPAQDYLLWNASSDIIVHIGNGAIVVNDGSFDLSPSDGMDLIKGIFKRSIIHDVAGNEAQVGTLSNNTKGLITQTELAGSDSLAAFRKVNTKVRGDGLTALVTDATVVVESTFGFDQQPDSYFQIVNTGAAGDTWTIYIAGTTADPTTPDRDVPSYTKVFTVVAGEVGDEIKLRDRIIQELNADTVFKNTVFLKAAKATDRAIVHIQSQKFSVSGDFWERPLAGDFNVTTTGTAVRILGFDNLISRSKPVTISRDRDSPHRLGLFGVTGSVSVTAKELSDLYVQEALLSGSSSMLVDGSSVVKDFTIAASSTTDLFIEDLIFDGQGNGIKFGQFMSQNTALTNGIEITIKSDDVTTVFPIIKSTEDFKNKWAALSGTGATFRIDVQAGRDEMLAILEFANPFILRAAGSFTTDDFIRVRIRDNLTSNLQRLNFRAKGFEKEP